jgi:hypothetical protein
VACSTFYVILHSFFSVVALGNSAPSCRFSQEEETITDSTALVELQRQLFDYRRGNLFFGTTTCNGS